MKTSSLIGHTVDLYQQIIHDSRPADSLIDRFFRERKYLGSHDRRSIAEIVYGMIRHRLWLDEVLRLTGISESEHGGTVYQFRSLLYLILIAGKDPGSLVSEFGNDLVKQEEMVERLILARNLAEKQKEEIRKSPNDSNRLSLLYSFPEWIVNQWISQFGVQPAEDLCASLNSPAPLTLRVNTLKGSVEECQKSLSEEGIGTERSRYSPFGLIAKKRMNVFQLKTFRDGFFEVQDEGSQLLPLLLDPKPRSKVVDACAGGGGKSLELAALMKNRGEIFALDVHEWRLDGLRKRIRRSGVDTIRVRVVTGSDVPEDLLEVADMVLIDAPCSGLGTIRRNPGLKSTVTSQHINELSTKQASILTLYSRCLKSGGRLVYATCTMMPQENEMVVEAFLNMHPDFELLAASAILNDVGIPMEMADQYFRLLPSVHGTDGFFAAILKRR